VREALQSDVREVGEMGVAIHCEVVREGVEQSGEASEEEGWIRR
jgi:hypothetical protein